MVTIEQPSGHLAYMAIEGKEECFAAIYLKNMGVGGKIPSWKQKGAHPPLVEELLASSGRRISLPQVYSP